MPLPQFGFRCGEFSVALSGNDIIMPGSKNQPLPKSLIPLADMNEAAGMYTLRALHGETIICDLPVHVLWVGHVSQPQPFLGFRSKEPSQSTRCGSIKANQLTSRSPGLLDHI
jgi:hypothetical protein